MRDVTPEATPGTIGRDPDVAEARIRRRHGPRVDRLGLPEARAGRDVRSLSATVRLWSGDDLAEFLSVPVKTLRQWRYLGIGPKAFKVGRHVRYDPEEVARWLIEECADAEDRSA
jgi:hypothetical protein